MKRRARVLRWAFALLTAFVAWYYHYPSAVSPCELYLHPDRYHHRFVRLSGMLGGGLGATAFGLSELCPEGHNATVMIDIPVRYLATASTRKRLNRLTGTRVTTPNPHPIRAGQAIMRWRESPAWVVGRLTYTPKSCFTSGINISAVVLVLPSNVLYLRRVTLG